MVRDDVRSEHAGGASATEFVLLLPVLVTLLFGMISGGILLYQYITISDATREASRFGATYPASSGDWATQVTNRLIAASGGQLDTTRDEICVSLVDETGSGLTYDNRTATPGTSCWSDGLSGPRAQVFVLKEGEWNAVFWSQSIGLDAESIARYELTKPSS